MKGSSQWRLLEPVQPVSNPAFHINKLQGPLPTFHHLQGLSFNMMLIGSIARYNNSGGS